MGLDMFLYRKTYVQGFDTEKQDIVTQIKVVDKQNKYNINPNKIVYITEEIGYWRKANAIHNFFIKECHKDDNGEPFRVPLGILRNLYERCKLILKDNVTEEEQIYQSVDGDEKIRKVKSLKSDTLAKSLLPTTSGFFFGSTEYDDSYVYSLEKTIEILEPIINGPNADNSDYIYEASW